MTGMSFQSGFSLQLQADFAAAHSGHHQIEQDQIRRPQRDPFQGGRAIRGWNDFAAQIAKNGADDLDVRGWSSTTRIPPTRFH